MYDFVSPFRGGLVGSSEAEQQESLEQALLECTGRLDVLTHPTFIRFFSLQMHYPDFMASLMEEEMILQASRQNPLPPPKDQIPFEKMVSPLRQQQSCTLESGGRVVDFAYLHHHEQEVLFVVEENTNKTSGRWCEI